MQIWKEFFANITRPFLNRFRDNSIWFYAAFQMLRLEKVMVLLSGEFTFYLGQCLASHTHTNANRQKHQTNRDIENTHKHTQIHTST